MASDADDPQGTPLSDTNLVSPRALRDFPGTADAIVDGIAGTRLPLLFHNSLDGSQSGALHVTITRCVSESAPFATEAAAQVNMAWRSRRASWER